SLGRLSTHTVNRELPDLGAGGVASRSARDTVLPPWVEGLRVLPDRSRPAGMRFSRRRFGREECVPRMRARGDGTYSFGAHSGGCAPLMPLWCAASSTDLTGIA